MKEYEKKRPPRSAKRNGLGGVILVVHAPIISQELLKVYDREEKMKEKTKNNTNNKLSVEDAAKQMGVSPQFVRVGLQKGIFPWGYAVQISTKRYSYFISRQKFCETLGIEEGVC